MRGRAIEESNVMDGLSVNLLKFFGVWGIVNCYRTTGKKNATIKLQFFFTLFINLPSIVCSAIVYLFIDVDIQKATVLLSHVVPCLQLCIRYMIFWTRLGSQSELFSLIKKDFLTIPESKRPAAVKIYEDVSRRTNLLCKAILSTNVVIIILWIGFPCISVEYIQHHTGTMGAVTGGRYKILGGWYPLPMGDTPYFEAIFIYEVLLVIWDPTLLAVYACVFYQPLMCLHAHYTVLSHHVSTLKVDSSKDGKTSDSAIYEQLYDAIREHQKLIRYTEKLKDVYNLFVTMTLGVGISMQIICVFQFLFGGVKDFFYVFKFLEFLAYLGVEVSMFCYGSSCVEEASSNLQLAIYSSEWYKADIKYRNTGQMVMLRSRKGMTLTAVKMYPVNLQTMMGIFQFTYTASALMSRMIEK